MNKILIASLVLFLYPGNSLVRAQYGFQDQGFQQFRVDILKLNGDLSANLLASDLKWYNAMIGALEKVYDPIVELNDPWIRACKSFPFDRLSLENAERFQDFCIQTPQQLQGSLSTISFQSNLEPFEHSGDVFYQKLLSQMNILAAMYNRNKLCVNPQMRKFTQIWKAYVDALIAGKAQTTRNVPEAFPNSLKESNSIAKILKELTKRVRSCSSFADPNKCIDSFFTEVIDCSTPNCVQLQSLAYQLDEKISAEFDQAVQENLDQIKAFQFELAAADRKWKSVLVDIQKCTEV